MSGSVIPPFAYWSDDMRYLWVLLMLCGLLPAGAAVTKTFTITEPFGLAWGPDRVSYPVEFPRGQVSPNGVALMDAAGNPVAVQLSDISYWETKQRWVKAATVSFMATLHPEETGVWTLTAGKKAAKQPKTDLAVMTSKSFTELTTAKTGIRLPAGNVTYPAAQDAAGVPAPVQAIRLGSGAWIGKGWWQTERPCQHYQVTILNNGPVFVRVALQYAFTDNTTYEAMVELNAGQDVAVISESYNLAEGKRYPMPELLGATPEQTFQFVHPHFDSPTQAMLWDWWCQSHGKVPSPNAYYFSFYPGLQPDSMEWNGRMAHAAVTAGDGGLAYAKDGRVEAINGYPQWGEDEAIYAGLYRADRPTEEVAVLGLRPSDWEHPDVEPHPVATLRQWVQTNDLWLEQRTAPDFLLRAPVCLGKRVYGLGALTRRKEADAKGAAVWRSDLMTRYMRLGKLELNEVKDWVLDYPEAAKYPRMFVNEGDLARLRERAKKNIPDLQHLTWVRYLINGSPADGKQVIAETIDGLRALVIGATAGSEANPMDYGTLEGVLANMADVALAVPEITPQQAALIRRYVAASVYIGFSRHFIPPRTAGFGWGAYNQFLHTKARAAMMLALIPHHPMNADWRAQIAELLTANMEYGITADGVVHESPHYNDLAIEFATVPLLALQHSGAVDLTRALARLKKVAHMRLATLLPWDVRGDFRSVAPMGDSYYESDGTLGMLASLMSANDPRVAGELQWGINESGRAFGGHPTPIGMLVDPDQPAVMPELHSEHLPGMAVVMRNGFPRKDETFFLAMAGSATIGHGHCDRGAFMLYAKGAPLMVDFAAMYTPSLREAWLHPGGLSFNHDETVKPCPGAGKPGCFYAGKVGEEHTVEPFTCLQPGWSPRAKDMDEAFGTVTRFATLPAADYAEMTRHLSYLNRVPYQLPETHGRLLTLDSQGDDVWLRHPFDWTRRYVFVKSPDPLGPNYLVIRDDLSGNTELNPALNLWCLADKLDVNGQRATYTGQFGVDLDCYIAEPSAFIARSHVVGHGNGFGFAAHYQQAFGKPFMETQTLCQVPQQAGKGGYFFALVPRKHAETAPVCATVLGGNGIQVTFPDRTDTVVLMNQPGTVTLDGLTLQGTAFVVTKTAKGTTVTLLAPGSLKQGEQTLTAGADARTVTAK